MLKLRDVSSWEWATLILGMVVALGIGLAMPDILAIKQGALHPPPSAELCHPVAARLRVVTEYPFTSYIFVANLENAAGQPLGEVRGEDGITRCPGNPSTGGRRSPTWAIEGGNPLLAPGLLVDKYTPFVAELSPPPGDYQVGVTFHPDPPAAELQAWAWVHVPAADEVLGRLRPGRSGGPGGGDAPPEATSAP